MIRVSPYQPTADNHPDAYSCRHDVTGWTSFVIRGDAAGRRLLRPTVNLAACLVARAGAGQVLVCQRVAESPAPEGVGFVDLGEQPLEGIARPMRLLEARRA